MKWLLLNLTLLASMSAFAIEPRPGDKLEIAVDWERIERGTTTGDFSCRGSCANISIDWKRTWLAVSGQSYRDEKRQNIAYCIGEFQKSKNSLDDINEMESEGEISAAEARIMTNITENTIKSVEILCNHKLGKKRTANLKKNILN